MKSKHDIDKLERVSRALGDPYRAQIMDAIRKSPEGIACQDIVQLFQLAQSTVSHHLKQLVDADLLEYSREGRCSLYKINKKTFTDLVTLLKKFEQ